MECEEKIMRNFENEIENFTNPDTRSTFTDEKEEIHVPSIFNENTIPEVKIIEQNSLNGPGTRANLLIEKQNENTAKNTKEDSNNLINLEFRPKTSILNRYIKLCANIIQIYPQYGEITTKRKVFKVTLNDNREFALKQIDLSNLSNSAITRKLDNIAREFYIGKALATTCKHIANIIDVQTIKEMNNNSVFAEILMEYGGISLDNINYKNMKSPNEIYEVMSQLIHIMRVLEKIGIAHFDLKPANLIWSSEKSLLKLIDFGTTISFFNETNSLFEKIDIHKMVGYTKGFCPPELLLGQYEKIFPQKFDVFSFGITFICLLFHKNNMSEKIELFEGKSEKELNDYLNKIELILRNTEFNESRWLPLIKKCLHFNPEIRASFKEIAKEFKAIFKTCENILPKIHENIDHYGIGKALFKLNQYEVSATHFSIYLNKNDFKNKKQELVEICANLMLLYNVIYRKSQKFIESFNHIFDKYILKAGGICVKNLALLGETLITCWNEYYQKSGAIAKNNWCNVIYLFYKRFVEIYESAYLPKNRDRLFEVYEVIIAKFLTINNLNYFSENFCEFIISKESEPTMNPIKLCEIYEKYSKYLLDFRTRKFALNCLNKSISIKKNLFGENSIEVAYAYEKLGKIYYSLDNLKEAERLLKLTFEIKSSNFGEMHKELIETCLNLVNLYELWKGKEVSLYYLYKALNITEKLNENSNDLLEFYKQISPKFIKFGEYEKSISLAEKTIEIQLKLRINNFSTFGDLLKSIGKLFLELQLTDKTTYCFLKLHEERLKLFGKHSIEAADSYIETINILTQIKNFEKAIEFCVNAINIYEKMKDKQIELADLYDKLAEIFAIEKKHDNACKFCNISIQIRQDLYNQKLASPELVLKSYDKIIHIYELEHDTQHALEFVQKAIDLAKKVLGENCCYVANHYDLIAIYCAHLKKHSEVDENCQKAINIRKFILGLNHPDIAISYQKIGSAYSSIFNFTKSIEFHKRNLDLLKTGVGKNHIKVAIQLERLACAYEKAGKIQEAVECGDEAIMIRNILIEKSESPILTSIKKWKASLEKQNKAKEMKMKMKNMKK